MHISIWQQYSSNHSSHFWVVGMFETVEAANAAYADLRHILTTIDTWYRENPQESQRFYDAADPTALAPPEAAFAAQYDVEWPVSIDWGGWDMYWLTGQQPAGHAQVSAQKIIDQTVAAVGKLIFVSNPSETWMGVQPFKGLLERMGARTAGYDLYMIENSRNFSVACTVSFTAPDAATADALDTAITTYLDGPLASADNPPPWHDDSANFEAAFAQGGSLRREPIERLIARWEKRLALAVRAQMPPAFREQVRRERLALKSGRLRREGMCFHLEEAWFHNEELGLAALIAYLEVHHCTDIECTVSTHFEEL